MGYRPARSLEDELAVMLADLAPHAARIAEKRHAFRLDVRWDDASARGAPSATSLVAVVA